MFWLGLLFATIGMGLFGGIAVHTLPEAWGPVGRILGSTGMAIGLCMFVLGMVLGKR